METIKQVYLIGLGAVGSAYAAKMNEAEPGPDSLWRQG